MRLKPILAIARRDLRCEFAAKQRGWILVGITALLLVPLSSVPTDVFTAESDTFKVTGLVPNTLKEVPGVTIVEQGAHMGFVPSEDGETLLTMGAPPSKSVRDALNQDGTDLEWIDVSKKQKMPNRSILFALVSASVLTGAIAESLSGERTNRTLQALLTAAITRFELVTGKWLAWAAYGAIASSLATLLSLLSGTTEVGWWILPLPLVPATTVALGLYMVRHATDRVSGATISLRMLPAVLSILAISAYFLGDYAPLLGAAIPIGGALIAIGQVWAGPGPALVSTTVCILSTFVLLKTTANQLELRNRPPLHRFRIWETFKEGLFGLTLWWIPLFGGLIWAQAGNVPLTRSLAPEWALLSASGALAMTAVVGWMTPKARPAAIPIESRVLWSTLISASLAGVCATALLTYVPTIPLFPEGMQSRLHDALLPTAPFPWLAFLLISFQELYFRGRLISRTGPVQSVIVFTLLACPFSPLYGLIIGTLLVWVHQRTAAIWPCIVVRFIAAYFGTLLFL